MFPHAKKRKIDAECRVFNKTWTTKYLFTEVRGRAVCLVCRERVAVFKDYNLNRHYETKHAEKYKNLTDAERAQTSEALLAKLHTQQYFFTKLHTSTDTAEAKTSSVISYKIAKNSKSFSEGFIRLVDCSRPFRHRWTSGVAAAKWSGQHRCISALALDKSRDVMYDITMFSFL